jgi:hypothetical protein
VRPRSSKNGRGTAERVASTATLGVSAGRG